MSIVSNPFQPMPDFLPQGKKLVSQLDLTDGEIHSYTFETEKWIALYEYNCLTIVIVYTNSINGRITKKAIVIVYNKL